MSAIRYVMTPGGHILGELSRRIPVDADQRTYDFARHKAGGPISAVPPEDFRMLGDTVEFLRLEIRDVQGVISANGRDRWKGVVISDFSMLPEIGNGFIPDTNLISFIDATAEIQRSAQEEIETLRKLLDEARQVRVGSHSPRPITAPGARAINIEE